VAGLENWDQFLISSDPFGFSSFYVALRARRKRSIFGQIKMDGWMDGLIMLPQFCLSISSDVYFHFTALAVILY